tara:strand:- start:21527 stop:21673 length:147 start_codon:yes stop_codon:yes gene_type:complete
MLRVLCDQHLLLDGATNPWEIIFGSLRLIILTVLVLLILMFFFGLGCN